MRSPAKESRSPGKSPKIVRPPIASSPARRAAPRHPPAEKIRKENHFAETLKMHERAARRNAA